MHQCATNPASSIQFLWYKKQTHFGLANKSHTFFANRNVAEHLLALSLTERPVYFRQHSHRWVAELTWPNWSQCDGCFGQKVTVSSHSFTARFYSSCDWNHKACSTNQQPVQGQGVSIHWCVFMVVQAHVNNTNHETFQCGGRQVALASLNTGCREWFLDSNWGQLQDLCQSPVWMLPSTSCCRPEMQVRGSEMIYLNAATLCNLFSLSECRVRKPGTGYTCQ